MEIESKPSPILVFIRKIIRNLLAKSSPMMDLVLFSLLTIGLSAAGFTYQNIYQTRQIAAAYRNIIGREWAMDRRIKQTILAELRTDHEVWDFLIDKLGPALIKGQRYNGESIRPQDKGMIMRDHMVVMQFQLRQLRVQAQKCDVSGQRLDKNQTLQVSGRSNIRIQGLESMWCYPRYSSRVEDTGQWQSQSYMASSTLKVMDRLTATNPYRGGGFVKKVPSHDLALYKRTLQELRDGTWTDYATRAVFLEFVTYAPAADQFVSVQVMFEYTVHGTILPQLFVVPFRNQLKKADGSAGSSNGPELLLYFIAFCNLLRELGKMRAFGFDYFRRMWSVITLISIFFVLISVYYRFLINREWTAMENLDTRPWKLDNNTKQWSVPWDWVSIGYYYQQLIKYQALALVGSWLRSFGYIHVFNKRIDTFVSSASVAQSSLSMFAVLLAFLLTGCAVAFFAGYGHEDESFLTFGATMLSLLEILFGNYDPDMLSLANGYLITTLLVITYALISIFSLSIALAVLSWANRQVMMGLVVFDHNDATELKEALTSWGRWFMRPCVWCCGITISRMSDVKAIKPAPKEKTEADIEAERLMIESESWIHRAKAGLKAMIRSAAVLRSRIRTLESEYHVLIEVSEPEFKRNNVWRKLRNNFQDEVFNDLLDMVRVGDTQGIKESLSSWKDQDWGADLEWRDAEGFTALHIAAFAGDADTVQALIKLRADVNGQNDDGNTPLHLAAMTGQLNACRVLVEEGLCLVNAVNMYSFTPIHLAAYTGNLEVLRSLVDEANADIYAQNDDGLTCLHCAVMQTNTVLAKYIAQRWPGILEVQANGGETALHAAIATRQPLDLIRSLLQCGARVGTKNYEGQNACQIAEEYGSAPAVQRLLYFVLRAGDDYHRASSTLDEGASTLALIQFGAAGRIADMKKLLDAGCNVDALQPGGGTALHMAIRRRKVAVMDALLEAGADPLVQDSEGRTSLMLAIEFGHFDEYKMLVSRIKVEEAAAPDADGNTILHFAALSGKSIRIVKHMVHTLRIDPFTKNFDGHTSLDCVKMAGQKLHDMEEAGMLHADEAAKASDLLKNILAFFNDREAYEDDDMMFQHEAQQRAAETGGRVEEIDLNDETDLYSMKMKKFFEQIGFKNYAKEYAMLFHENEIDVDGLAMVTDVQLKEMGIMVIGTRNKILAGIKKVHERNANRGMQAWGSEGQVLPKMALGAGGEEGRPSLANFPMSFTSKVMPGGSRPASSAQMGGGRT